MNCTLTKAYPLPPNDKAQGKGAPIRKDSDFGSTTYPRTILFVNSF